MTEFEKEPNNLELASKLFRELNKHGMYISVIRLFFKNKLDTTDTKKRFYTEMMSQYDYAKDHIEMIKVTQGADGSTGEHDLSGVVSDLKAK